ncbi:MAG: cytochrome ubiquinol oxidase subunit I [Acidilobus sp.]
MTFYSSVFWLAFNFGIHIVMVNLVIGLAVLVPLLKYLGEKRGDQLTVNIARRLMKYYAVTYGVAGVFGTAFTVFLFSYYPFATLLLGTIAIIPFAIAIAFVGLNFFSLIAYWYGWDRWSPRTHNLIGILMAASAVMIPFGFRGVFAFLNEPVGLEFTPSGPTLNGLQAYSNPTFWPLYLSSVVGALTATMIAIMAGFGVAYLRSPDPERAYFEASLRKFLIPSLIGLLVMIPLMFAYLMSLVSVPFKFNSIMEGFGVVIGDTGSYDFSWIFVLHLAMVAIQFLSLLYLVYAGFRGSLVSRGSALAAIIGGAAALGGIEAGEMLNAFSQFPRFIASLTSQQALSFPQPYGQLLATYNNLTNYNSLAAAPFAQFFTSFMMAVMIVVLVAFIYVIFFKKK